jgi:serine/threonine protein kinase
MASRIAGRYELQEQLGEGGMGVVWRALDSKTGSSVAIKLMKDISDPVAVELFTKEWRALAEMCHPNIVDVRDVDVIDENNQKKPFFVMPLLRGATLADLIDNASARLTVARIVEIAIQVCRGLQAAHQRGLVHRDLKPSNIFVMDDDTAKIIDFGVVHLAGSKSVTGQKGTFQYMSPEQAQLKEITPASDLFSLGIILYEALTGRRPFARVTARETLDAVINFIPPPVSEINPSINQSVSKVVHKCLAKQPIHRFASARDLAETMQKAFRNEPVFDSAKIEPRIERARAAFKSGDEGFASEILAELEAEGNLDPRITLLRMQIDLSVKQKKIRHLLEGARARLEQDEIPLALGKIREVLELDPQNPDALAMRLTMEKQRSETQIAKWFELAQAHLGNRDFGAARQAAQEVLAIRRGDTRAMDLMEKIDSTEADARRIREQKEHLYSSALQAYHNGEIETALSKLERLFSVAAANPNAAVPERDAVYQSFYKEVRSERDIIQRSFEDAQRQFGDKNFAGAIAVCRELLAKYPNDGTFQALKIRIEDAERQELSRYIAEVSNRVESEPDLDRRANILREACERYPNEAQFAQQLKLIRERRDLVNSIVAKARQYEERGQNAEAISQWDILRNIHPQYPGIAFEIEQCRKKLDLQAREEEHGRLVEEIDGLMQSRIYAKAIERADASLREFPGDAEISGLRSLAEQGLQKAKESRRLFEEGQRALAEKNFERATEFLRNSLSLDPRAAGLRDSLVNALAERARMLADENWREAEPLCQEASELDSNHPAVRALRSSISEAKRQMLVGQCLAECRAMVAAGNVQQAATRVGRARAEFPNDARLEQYAASLQKELDQARDKEERSKDRAALNDDRRRLEQDPDLETLADVLDRSHAIQARHPDDPEVGKTVAEIELTVKRVARVDDLSQLLKTGTHGGREERPAFASMRVPATIRAGGEKRPQIVNKSVDKTMLSRTPDTKLKHSSADVVLRTVKNFVADRQQKALTFVRPEGNWSEARLGAIGGILVLIAVVGYFIIHTPGAQQKVFVAPSAQKIHIIANPPESIITTGGNPLQGGEVVVGSMVEVSRVGYQTKRVQIQQDSDGKIALEPEPVRLSIHSAENAGTVELDGQQLSDLSGGSMDKDDLAPDGKTRKLSVITHGTPLFTVEFNAHQASLPEVTALEANEVFVITSMGNSARLYGASHLQKVRFGDQVIPLSPSGSNLTLSEQNHEIVFGEGKEQGSVAIDISNAPMLAVYSLNAGGEVQISTTAENARLTVDGLPVQQQKHRWRIRKPPGAHTFVMSAEGYESQTWTMTLLGRQVLTKKVELVPTENTGKMVALFISGGTPGAAVALDGKSVGELDANGHVELSGVLTPGNHMITLAKPDFESRNFGIYVNPPSDARISDAALAPSGAWLGFQVAAKNVTVKYHRIGDPQLHDVNPATRIQPPPGQYEILWEAPGFEKSRTVVNLGKENVTIPLKLTSIQDYEFQDLNQITHEGDWIKARNPGSYVNLKAGNLHENLVFSRPGKTLFWNKKVEWMIESPERHARVQYALEGQKLIRKLVVGEKTSNAIEMKVDAQIANQITSLSVHVAVEDAHVRISNDKGVVLDDFVVPGQDFSNGRINIRTDSSFVVRNDKQ